MFVYDAQKQIEIVKQKSHQTKNVVGGNGVINQFHYIIVY